MKFLIALVAILPSFANADVISCESKDGQYKFEFSAEKIEQTPENREILKPLPYVVTGKMTSGDQEVANVGERCPEVQKKNRFTHRCNFDFSSVGQDLSAEVYVDAVKGTKRASAVIFVEGKINSGAIDCN